MIEELLSHTERKLARINEALNKDKEHLTQIELASYMGKVEVLTILIMELTEMKRRGAK